MGKSIKVTVLTFAIFLSILSPAFAVCVNPGDMIGPYSINTSSTFCTGTYHINVSGFIGALYTNASNIVLDCNGSTIIGNVSGGEEVGVFINRSSNVTFRDCNITGYSAGSVFLYYSNDSNIWNVTTGPNSAYGAIRLASSSRNNLTNNSMSGSFRGIYLESVSYNNTIRGNQIIGSTDNGLELWTQSDGNRIISNNISANNDFGIELQNVDSNHFENNTIMSNGGYGIFLTAAACYYNNFTGNNISLNGGAGVNISSGNANNTFWNNYFNNTVNAWDNGADNKWNITKTIGTNIINSGSFLGGNYWNDYTGVDSDGDGLGDTNYTIGGTANFADLLPLTNARGCMNLSNGTASYYVNASTTLCVGIYYINVSADQGALWINNNSLVLDCNGSTIYGNGSGNGIYVLNFNNVTIKNCRVGGYSYDILTDTVSRINITNNTGYNSTSSTFRIVSTTNSTLTSNLAMNTSGTGPGFTLHSSHGNTLTSNVAHNVSSAYGFLLQDSNNNTLVNNTAYSQGDGFSTASTANNNTFLNNRAYNNSGTGFYMDVGSNNLTGNNASNNVEHGFRVSSAGNTLTSNIANNNTDHGFYVTDPNNTLTSNYAYNNSQSGFYVDNTLNVTLTSNNASFNNHSGFYLSSSRQSSLSMNRAFNNSGHGYYSALSTGNDLTSNYAYNNSNNGFYISTASENTTLSDNDAIDNLWSGFQLDFGASNITLTDSRARANSRYGVFLNFTTSNRVTSINTTGNALDGLRLTTAYFNNFTDINSSSNDNYGVFVESSLINNLTDVYVSNSSNWAAVDLSLSNRTTLSRFTVVSNEDNGIYLGTSRNNTIEHSTVSTLNASGACDGLECYGIFLDHNSSYNTVFNNTLSSNAAGVLLNDNSSDNNISNNSILNSTTYGIALINILPVFGEYGNSRNTLSGNNISSATGWDFYANASGVTNVGNIVRDTWIGGTKVSFTFYEVMLRASAAPAADPGVYHNISKYINATYANASSWLYLNVSYTAAEAAGLDESTLAIWRYNGSSWNNTSFADGAGVNAGTNWVWANVSNFSIFAPMAQAASPSCVTPGNLTSPYYINNTTTLCTGTYNITVSNSQGALWVNNNSIVLDCNGSTIYGDYSGYGVFVNGSFSNVTVENCNISRYDDGIYLRNNSGNTLINNTVGPNNDGIWFVLSSNNILFNNTIHSANVGVRFTSSHNNTLINNTVNDSRYGVIITLGSNNTLTSNTITNSIEYGLRLDTSSNNNLTSNNVSYNTGDVGISLGSSSNNTITNNTANNNEYGLYLELNSNTNTITSNTFSSNTKYGLYVKSSSGNAITNTNSTSNLQWDFYSTSNFENNNVTNLTTGSVMSSFTSHDIALKSTTAPVADPSGYRNISKYLSITNTSASSWIYLNISYSGSDAAGLDESTLAIWRYNDTNWNNTRFATGAGANTGTNWVWANISNFSTFAPLGSITTLQPQNFVASLNSTDNTSVDLGWSNVSMADGYLLYYDTNVSYLINDSNLNITNFQVNLTGSANSSYTDTVASLNLSVYYRIAAYNGSTLNLSANTAGKYTFNVSAANLSDVKMNLVSLPLEPENYSLSSLIRVAPSELTTVGYYNASLSPAAYKTAFYKDGEWTGNFTTLALGVGYVVTNTQGFNFIVAGTVPNGTQSVVVNTTGVIPGLVEVNTLGWTSSVVTYDLNATLNATGMAAGDTVSYYNASSQAFETITRDANGWTGGFNSLQPGKGYFFTAANNYTWSYNST